MYNRHDLSLPPSTHFLASVPTCKRKVMKLGLCMWVIMIENPFETSIDTYLLRRGGASAVDTGGWFVDCF